MIALYPPVLHNYRIGAIAIYANLGGYIRAGPVIAYSICRADISAGTTVSRIDARVGAGIIADDQASHAGTATIDAGHSQRADISA